jgi:hypothetical protein
METIYLLGKPFGYIDNICFYLNRTLFRKYNSYNISKLVLDELLKHNVQFIEIKDRESLKVYRVHINLFFDMTKAIPNNYHTETNDLTELCLPIKYFVQILK